MWCHCVYGIPHPHHLQQWVEFREYISKKAYESFKEYYRDEDKFEEIADA